MKLNQQNKLMCKGYIIILFSPLKVIRYMWWRKHEVKYMGTIMRESDQHLRLFQKPKKLLM